MTYDHELLAILGLPYTTIVNSDYQNLTYYCEPQRLTARQTRNAMELSEYDIKIHHVPGNKLIQVDNLSRRPVHADEKEEDTVLPGKLFVNLVDIELAN